MRFLPFFILILGLFAIYGCEDDDQPPKMPVRGHWSSDIDSAYVSWSCSDPDGDKLEYDLFFGLDSDPPRVRTRTTETRYECGGLYRNTTYYWKVIAYDTDGYSSESPVWDFHTGDGWINLPEPPENPSHGDEWTVYLGYYRVPMEMIYIERGSFMMGALDYDTCATNSERPRHIVVFDYGFWIGKYEVTWAQYESINGNEPDENDYSIAIHENNRWLNLYEEFIDLINDKIPGNPMRLPSESEWEYCCRAGTETIYFWGDDPELFSLYARCNMDTTESRPPFYIGTKLANPWGLFDMLGNANEFVQDESFNPNYTGFGFEGAPQDGSPRTNLNSGYRVIKSGYLGYPPEEMRCSSRLSGLDNFPRRIGFRVVIDPRLHE